MSERRWTIKTCPTCGELPESLGSGRWGCGRHTGTRQDYEFVPVAVMPVAEHEERLAEAQRWADDPEHPNWEAGWYAGSRRSGPVTDLLVLRGAKAAWDAHRTAAAEDSVTGVYQLPEWASLDQALREAWLRDTRATLEAVLGR